MNNAFKVQHQLKNEMLVNVKKREGRIWGRERESNGVMFAKATSRGREEERTVTTNI